MSKDIPLSEKSINLGHGEMFEKENVKEAVKKLKEEIFMSLEKLTDNEIIEIINQIFGSFE